jgi:hypothetical protein
VIPLIEFWSELDHYFVAHWINWFLAAIIVRDYYILHFWSIFDEIIGKLNILFFEIYA